MHESKTTYLDYLKEAANYCRERPAPIGFLEIEVNTIGILVCREVNGLYCGQYVSWTEFEHCRFNPIITAAQQVETKLKAQMKAKAA